MIQDHATKTDGSDGDPLPSFLTPFRGSLNSSAATDYAALDDEYLEVLGPGRHRRDWTEIVVSSAPLTLFEFKKPTSDTDDNWVFDRFSKPYGEVIESFIGNAERKNLERLLNLTTQTNKVSAKQMEALARQSRLTLEALKRKASQNSENTTYDTHENSLSVPVASLGSYMAVIGAGLGLSTTLSGITFAHPAVVLVLLIGGLTFLVMGLVEK